MLGQAGLGHCIGNDEDCFTGDADNVAPLSDYSMNQLFAPCGMEWPEDRVNFQ